MRKRIGKYFFIALLWLVAYWLYPISYQDEVEVIKKTIASRGGVIKELDETNYQNTAFTQGNNRGNFYFVVHYTVDGRDKVAYYRSPKDSAKGIEYPEAWIFKN